MYRYVPFKEKLHSDELGTYISFGIKAFDSSDCLIASVSDVSTDKVFVQDLCEKCTLHQLHPIHLLDVIEDNI